MPLQYMIAAAIIPAVLLVWFFYKADARPEPPRVVLWTFGLGVLSTLGVLAIVIPIKLYVFDFATLASPIAAAAGRAFCFAAIPEELFKFGVLFFYAARHRAFDEPMDGIVYGATASLGFAALENIMYTVSGGMVVAIMRAITAVPAHACFGAVMGYFVGRARFRRSKAGWLFYPLALFWPIVLHGLYDFPLMASASLAEVPGWLEGVLFLGAILVLVLGVVWTLLLVRKMKRRQRRENGVEQKEPTPTPAPIPLAKRRAKSGVGTIVMLVSGAILTGLGALVLLGCTIGFFTDPPEAEQVIPVLCCVGVLGIFPTAGGVVLFLLGLRRLHGGQSK